MTATQRGYHHGDLRRAILTAAAEMITESGPAALSLRELARRAGVSHAAPAHHFGDKAGLLTALAAEGFGTLADDLEAAGADFLEVGMAYLRFAIEHPAHFDVMFHPELYRADDPEVLTARGRARITLEQGLRDLPQPVSNPAAGLAAWSIVHGFASLWLSGALPASVSADPEIAARPVLRMLFDRS